MLLADNNRNRKQNTLPHYVGRIAAFRYRVVLQVFYCEIESV